MADDFVSVCFSAGNESGKRQKDAVQLDTVCRPFQGAHDSVMVCLTAAMHEVRRCHSYFGLWQQLEQHITSVFVLNSKSSVSDISVSVC